MLASSFIKPVDSRADFPMILFYSQNIIVFFDEVIF